MLSTHVKILKEIHALLVPNRLQFTSNTLVATTPEEEITTKLKHQLMSERFRMAKQL